MAMNIGLTGTYKGQVREQEEEGKREGEIVWRGVLTSESPFTQHDHLRHHPYFRLLALIEQGFT